MQPRPQDLQPRHHRVINTFSMFLAVFLAGIGALRLLNVLLLLETVKPLPLDGWLPMSLRVVAVLFVLGMLMVSRLRQRYLLILLSLGLLTSAGLGLRLASRLPQDLQATGGAATLVMTLCGLGLFIAGLAQGENLAGFAEETWLVSSRAVLRRWLSKNTDQSSDNH